MSEAPITARPHTYYIRPAPGWLDQLEAEILSVVSTPLQKYKFEPKITKLKGTVKLHRCDWRQGFEVMLRLTMAHDVEWLVLESKCTRWSEVDAILARVPWAEILPNRDTPIHVTTDVSHGFSESSGKLRENLCKMANVKHVSEGAPLRFKIELRGDFLRVSASLCGEPLYKRGYKMHLSAKAPIGEHHAAACVRWVLNGNENASISTVFVPFAGSGTFGFEAILALLGAGPGSFSRSFACDLFPCTPAPTLKFLRRKMAERLSTGVPPIVFFNDFNAEAIATLKANIVTFPRGRFEIIEGDVFNMKPVFASEGRIMILLNPPYGDRLAKDAAIPVLYSRLGDSMRELGRNQVGRVLGGCLCPDERTWKGFLNRLGVDTAETHHFTHGGKEMRIVRWQT